MRTDPRAYALILFLTIGSVAAAAIGLVWHIGRRVDLYYDARSEEASLRGRR